MPRVPTLGADRVAGTLQPAFPGDGGAGTILSGTEQLIGQLKQTALEAREEEIQRKQRTRNSEGRRQVTQFLNGLSEEMALRNDTEFPVEHAQRANAGLQEILSQYEDDGLVHGAITEFGGRAVDAQQRAMGLRAAGLQHKLVVQELGLSIEAHADAAGIAGSDEQYQLAIDAADNEIQLAMDEGDISAADALEMQNHTRELAANARARKLIRVDPEEALTALQDPEHAFMAAMDPEQREIFIASAQNEIERQSRQSAQALAEARNLAEKDFLARIYDDDLENNPTQADVFGSILTGTRAQTIAKLIRDQASGADLNFTDEALTNDLWDRVWNPRNPQPITAPEQLVQYLGRGLSREDFDKLTTDLTSGSDPNRQSDNALFTDFITRGRGQISKASLLGLDPFGEKQAHLFRHAATEALRIKQAEGMTMLEALDQDNPKGINFQNSLVERFQGTRDDQRRARRELRDRTSGRTQIGIAGHTAARQQEAVEEAAAALIESRRQEGESAEDFLKRQGL